MSNTEAATDLPPAATLADKLEWLIQNMWPADLPPARNNVEIAAAITSRTDEDISSTTVWKIRTGRQDNPQLKTLTALAAFFAVPIGYFGFTAEAAPISEDLTYKALLNELRTGDTPPEVIRALINLTPQTRWLIHQLILTAATADQNRHPHSP